ncbi:microtubule-associated protein tau-like [Sus scrofa]|uniref:microtubule-associated protein tau-like n=1 Tax=Sus scrofa TaxID=9823 RepID=UPI000A2B1BEB|nr:microtubule-associated protein tau-like [Sus scrofa]
MATQGRLDVGGGPQARKQDACSRPGCPQRPHHLSRQKTRRGVKTCIPSHVIPPSWLPLAALPARRPTLGHDALSSGALRRAQTPRPPPGFSPAPGRRRWCPGRASGPSQPASRSPHSQFTKLRLEDGHTHTHTHTHTHARTHCEEGSLILSHWRLGPERKIVWVNSQASRLNVGSRPCPSTPSASPTPLPPHPPPTLGSAAGPRASSAQPAGSPGPPGSKGRGPEGKPYSLCPGGQKRTAGRWDRPGPRVSELELSDGEQWSMGKTKSLPRGSCSLVVETENEATEARGVK